MDKFVKNFIIASVIYLALSTLLGVAMLQDPQLLAFKFVHSHLNMLGWVSMMIYGVGYHILPKFAGKLLKHPKLGELQFWLANISLIILMIFYSLNVHNASSLYRIIATCAGAVHAVSIGIFFYNMLITLLPAPPPIQR